ncbi:uncharacterized protein LOC127027943 [Gymnogyps californianus]|uniref:uncharacterized protein LOC127027943 n=1 Tax=Gymnogyps californianus TaxID=33616 RepID=UPI0021C5DC3B|nr:uncharacterized protein LOC127027943 [Gymnogyps californianus]
MTWEPAQDPLKVDGFPTSWSIPVLEPESNPTDEGGGNGYPASRLDVGLEPLRHPGAMPVGDSDPASRLGSRTEPLGDGMVTEVPVGRTFPAPRLDAALEPSWHRRGPPRAKPQAEGGKKSPEASEVLRQMLEELERGHESEREAVRKEAFPEGSSGSLPVSAKETEAMKATGTPALSKPGEDHHGGVYEFFRTDSGSSQGRRLPDFLVYSCPRA